MFIRRLLSCCLLTFINFAEERIALYGTVGAVKITDILYSCSKRWLKTSMCKRPRKPNLGKKRSLVGLFLYHLKFQSAFFLPSDMFTQIVWQHQAQERTSKRLNRSPKNEYSLWKQTVSQQITYSMWIRNIRKTNAFNLYLSLNWIKASNLLEGGSSLLWG